MSGTFEKSKLAIDWKPSAVDCSLFEARCLHQGVCVCVCLFVCVCVCVCVCVLESCQDRPGWRRVASSTTPPRPAPDPLLCVCGRPFRRPGDLKRHAKFGVRVLT